MAIFFLNLDDVLHIHRNQIALYDNEAKVQADEQRLFDTTMAVAQGNLGKAEVAPFFREIAL